MCANELPIVRAFVEPWIERWVPQPIEEREVEHRQAQSRKYDSGDDETVARA